MAEESRRRELLVSKSWVQASIVVILFGFFVLGLLAYRTYAADPPIPDTLVRSDGAVDVIALSAVLGASIAVTGRLLGAFRRTPSGFPITPPTST